MVEAAGRADSEEANLSINFLPSACTSICPEHVVEGGEGLFGEAQGA